MKRQLCSQRLCTWTMLLTLIANISTRSEARLGKSNIFSEKIKNRPEDEFIVVFKDDFDKKDENSISLFGNDNRINNNVKSRAEKLRKKYALKQKKTYSDAIKGFVATNFTSEDAENLRKEDDVLLVELNAKIKIGPANSGIAVQSSGRLCDKQIIPESVERVGWKNAEKKKYLRDKRVFVIDTGIANIPQEFNIDTNLARNFVGGNSRDWEDCHGHGTHVAGTIGAKDNGCGVVGVAAGIWLVPLKVVDCYGNGDMKSVIEALDHVYQVGIAGDVVNMSLGSMISQKSMDVAVKKVASLGIKFALAAGNDSRNSKLYSPARVQANGVYTVCALTQSGNVASFSNFGKPPIDTCAPGSNVMSLAPNGQTWVRSGTSMAAPHVAGLLALGRVANRGTVYNPRDNRYYPVVSD